MPAHETIVSAIDARAAELAQLARKIHAHPELRFEEKQASAWLAETVASVRRCATCASTRVPARLSSTCWNAASTVWR